MNYFERLSYLKDDEDFILPTRATENSAGYDFYAPEDYVIEPGETVLIQTGIKVHLYADQFLQLHVRSSFGIKRNLILPNCTGIIDADYYDNPDNEGEIIGALTNIGKHTQYIKKGEAFMQGIFLAYDTTYDDYTTTKRTGGIGSTTTAKECDKLTAEATTKILNELQETNGVTVTYEGDEHISFTYYRMPCMLFTHVSSDSFTIIYNLMDVDDESDEHGLLTDFLWESKPYDSYGNIEDAIKDGLLDFLKWINNSLDILQRNAQWTLNKLG